MLSKAYRFTAALLRFAFADQLLCELLRSATGVVGAHPSAMALRDDHHGQLQPAQCLRGSHVLVEHRQRLRARHAHQGGLERRATGTAGALQATDERRLGATQHRLPTTRPPLGSQGRAKT